MAGIEKLSLAEHSDEVSTYGSTLTYTSSGSRSRSWRQQQRWTRHSRTRRTDARRRKQRLRGFLGWFPRCLQPCLSS
ncbi:hypothetical protein GBAR_LOCUS28135 [Geodia barretti]|uniref:Uncharacterized protein n=1 Tax=Geodia barretti TaxID=519541 RepID=A0AA35TPG7_GEOBA|nr:hypothetical protein GBAR_LOCUS28135 [Geodia barretti]